jgi:hypothetical protein
VLSSCGKRDETSPGDAKTRHHSAPADSSEHSIAGEAHDPLVLFEQLVADANAHDPAAVMDHFASNARYEIIGDPVVREEPGDPFNI